MGDVVRRVEDIVNAINNDYLDIIKLTGLTPDSYRDYGFSQVMPDTMIDMVRQSRNLYDVICILEGKDPALAENFGATTDPTPVDTNGIEPPARHIYRESGVKPIELPGDEPKEEPKGE